jgi:hypothetical protein
VVILSSGDILRTIPQEKDYPGLETFPVLPSSQQPRPQVTLSELIPGKYISTTRVVYLKTSERHDDALCSKAIFSGIFDDCERFANRYKEIIPLSLV